MDGKHLKFDFSLKLIYNIYRQLREGKSFPFYLSFSPVLRFNRAIGSSKPAKVRILKRAEARGNLQHRD